MHLVALSMVKNEIDVIELFVRHTLQYFDGLFIVDNASSDGTRETLADLAARGAPVTVIDDPRTENLQSERMTALYRRAIRTFDVDYVIPLDADEFLRAGSRSDLEHALAKIPRDAFARIPWQTYVMRPEDAQAEGDLLQRIRSRRRIEKPLFEKVALPASMEWADRAIIMPGNHDVRTDRGERPPEVKLEGVTIAHFPVRSVQQIETKVITGWISQLARGQDLASKQGNWHWREIYQLILDRRLSIDDASRISMNYARQDGGDLLAPFSPSDLVEDPVQSDAVSSERRRIDPLLSVAHAAVAALLGARSQPAVAGPLRGWRWRRRNRQRLEALGLAPATEAGALSVLRDRFQPRSILVLGSGSDRALAWLRRNGAERIVHARSGRELRGEDPFDLVLALDDDSFDGGIDASLSLDAVSRRAAGPVLFSIGRSRGAHLPAWLDRWETLGFVVDGWLSASLRVLATPKSTCPADAVLLVRKGEQTPGPFGRAELAAVRT